MTKTETGAPWRWALALICGGALVMIAQEVTVGVFSFRTADGSVTLWGVPVDALNKTATGTLAGFLAFGGVAVTAWLITHDRASLRRQARIAGAVTLCASIIAIWNLATALGYYRRSAEAPRVAASIEFTTAKSSYAAANARLSGQASTVDASGFVMTLTEEESFLLQRQAKSALEVIRRGEAPTGGEKPGWLDLVRAIIAHLLGVAPAAAFRLPEVRTKKKAKRPPARGQKPKLVEVA